VNKLKIFMKEICQLAGLKGVSSNHSGKKDLRNKSLSEGCYRARNYETD
jgi:hypothetical protein